MSRTQHLQSLMVTDGAVYRAPIAGKLVGGLGVCQDAFGLFPLQRHAPMGDVHRGVPVGVAGIPTFAASEQRSSTIALGRMPAPRASPRCVPRRDDEHRDTRLCSHGFERRSKLVVGHPLDLAVGRPVQTGPVEMLQVLDGDGTGFRHGEVDDLVGDLVTAGLSVVGFVVFEPAKAALGAAGTEGGFGLQPSSAAEDVLLRRGDVGAKVELLRTVIVERADRCEDSATDIQAKHPIGWLMPKLPLDGEGRSPASVLEIDPKMRGGPSPVEVPAQALVCPILRDGQRHSAAAGREAKDWIPAFGDTEAATSWDVEGSALGSGPSTRVLASSPSITDGIDRELRVQSELLPQCLVDDLSEIAPGQRFFREAVPPFDGFLAEVDRADIGGSESGERVCFGHAGLAEVDREALDDGGHLGTQPIHYNRLKYPPLSNSSPKGGLLGGIF